MEIWANMGTAFKNMLGMVQDSQQDPFRLVEKKYNVDKKKPWLLSA